MELTGAWSQLQLLFPLHTVPFVMTVITEGWQFFPVPQKAPTPMPYKRRWPNSNVKRLGSGSPTPPRCRQLHLNCGSKMSPETKQGSSGFQTELTGSRGADGPESTWSFYRGPAGTSGWYSPGSSLASSRGGQLCLDRQSRLSVNVCTMNERRKNGYQQVWSHALVITVLQASGSPTPGPAGPRVCSHFRLSCF